MHQLLASLFFIMSFIQIYLKFLKSNNFKFISTRGMKYYLLYYIIVVVLCIFIFLNFLFLVIFVFY